MREIRPSFGVSVYQLAIGTVSLPLFGLTFGVGWSIFYHFDDVTKTHCDVAEFAPSISAAVGSNFPQKNVWDLCIALHALPRFLFFYLYRNAFHERLTVGLWTPTLIEVNYTLNWIENLCLIGLSFVSSSELYQVHATCFVTFLITAMTSMLLSRFYLYNFCGFQVRNRCERDSLAYKKKLVIVTYASAALSAYFYWRHNEYCEPYVYSLFGMTEYVLVLCNMAYHGLAALDFRDHSVRVASDVLLVR